MNEQEAGKALKPKWDAAGLITAVVTDDLSGELLMVAHMNEAALDLTFKTGFAHFWSRSRGALWKKGETSGSILTVIEAWVDCDQDALWLKCAPAGPACHTGEPSCFYRRIERGKLVREG